MKDSVLRVNQLHVEREGKKIIQGLDMDLPPGEVHIVMGPNGAGKSTFAHALAGHPFYSIPQGTALLHDRDLLVLDPEERAALGLFVGFQNPVEVPNVQMSEWVHVALDALQESQASLSPEERKRRGLEDEGWDAEKRIRSACESLGLSESWLSRQLNEGLSGGEKKKNEVLQLLLFGGSCAILDETDSGLDVDAITTTAQGIRSWMRPERSLLVITHYHRFIQLLSPDRVHIMMNGSLVESGDMGLADRVNQKGYQEWGYQEEEYREREYQK